MLIFTSPLGKVLKKDRVTGQQLFRQMGFWHADS